MAQPALVTNGNKTALYQPVGAAVLEFSGSGPEVSVFWAEGNVSPDSGYTALRGVSRPVDGSWSSSSKDQISLRLSP